MEKNKIYQGDSLEVLKTLPDESINCVITSPPYYLLRDYLVDGQIGLENTYQEYIKKLIDIFSEIKRVLKKDGTCFVNIADTFAGSGCGRNGDGSVGKAGTLNKKNKGTQEGIIKSNKKQILQKSLMAIPARFQIAMTNNDWQLKDDLTKEEKDYVLTELIKRDIL